jgi:hypothetical protein
LHFGFEFAIFSIKHKPGAVEMWLRYATPRRAIKATRSRVDFRSSAAITTFPASEVKIMLIKTHRNGGVSSLKEVAMAWKQEDHHFHWSEFESDAHMVELAKKLHDAELHPESLIPTPRKVH